MEKKKFAAALAGIILCLFLAGCGDNRWNVSEGVIWRTTYRIVYNGPNELSDSILPVLEKVEMSLSPFRNNSLISRINHSETDSTDTFVERTFNIATAVNRASNGKFDPTVAPLVNLWGFGTDSAARRQTESGTLFEISRERLDSALALVGIAECRISDNRIIKKHPATTFNFSAITKGLACDMVGEMLRRNRVENYMVEIGGEIALSGHNREGKPWQIQIDAPVASGDAPVHEQFLMISADRGGIATSGNYRNFHQTERYGRIGHTIDPVSGEPAKSEVLSATVTAPTCAEADAWATACMATPMAADAIAMIKKAPEVEALLVVAEGDSLITLASADCLFK